MRSLRESHSSTRFTLTVGRCINFDLTRTGGGNFLTFVSIRLLRVLGWTGGLQRLMMGRMVLHARRRNPEGRSIDGPSGRGAWGLLRARVRGWLGIPSNVRRRLVR